ncbi:MAG: thioredoxin fold domain-containing protein [Phycisphaerales bacterium]|nr:thioredoxin fold domain-containing protein [Phycisphaerales bacterium]
MLVFNLAGCDSGTAAHDPTPWVKDFPAAQSDAAAGGKPMLINFTADWCPPCQDMKKQTLPDPAVQQMLTEKFVTLKVDLTSPGQAENELSQKYGVQYIPTFILVSSEGKVLAQRSGFVPKVNSSPGLNQH